MRTADFSYELPEALIALRPPAERDGSRLLVVRRGSGGVEHRRFVDLPDLLEEPTLLVVNDTRVFPARLVGRRASSGRAELLLLESLEEGGSGEVWSCLGKPMRKLRPGTQLSFDDDEGVVQGEVLRADGEALIVRLRARGGVRSALERCGRVPLPPYIRREAEPEDVDRYQTVYARADGSVAAPTAGLHFTAEVRDRLEARGHRWAAVTLHVGPGTFLPVRSETLEDHRMHGERFEVSREAASAIASARSEGRRVLAVGTTVVRALESAAAGGGLRQGSAKTELFIKPGHEFRVVDALLTNFHLPRSTLLALVCAFAGHDLVLSTYREAVRRQYRFYSYGDAMLLL